MTDSRPKVLIVGDQRMRHLSLLPADLDRLAAIADWEWLHLEGGAAYGSNKDSDAIRRLLASVGGVDAIVVSNGCPLISAEVMDSAPRLRIIGELEGDRFAHRIDVEAAWERGIRTVDTTHSSSYPVAEWALAMILISLRNAGARYRSILAGEAPTTDYEDFGYLHGELTGKRVGLIGCGHIGRRLVKYLQPFEVDISVYDPYLASEMPDAIGVVRTSLENLLSQSDVIVCLAPITPATEGMIGRRELDMIRSNSVFVNVSRGAIVDSDALIARLKRGDIVAGPGRLRPGAYPAGQRDHRAAQHLPEPPHRGRDASEQPALLHTDGRTSWSASSRATSPYFSSTQGRWRTAEARRHPRAEASWYGADVRTLISLDSPGGRRLG